MKNNPVKCPNCGAALLQDEDKPVLFCPYCGAELPKEESAYEYSRFVLKHNEEVRQRQEKETNQYGKRVMLIILAIFIVVGLAIYLGVVRPHSVRVAKLEATLNEIYVDINEGRYDEAMTKAVTLRLDDDVSGDENRYWNNQREAVIKLIKERQR